MKRFSEIKELLRGVYFTQEESPYVASFLENIGIGNAQNLIVTDFDISPTNDNRTHISAHSFLQECIEHQIAKHFPLRLMTSIAIEEYKYQQDALKQSKAEHYNGEDKLILWTFAMAANITPLSLKEFFSKLREEKEEEAYKVIQAIERMLK